MANPIIYRLVPSPSRFEIRQLGAILRPAWKWAKLALIYSKRLLQHDSVPLFQLAPRFKTFLLRHAQRSKFLDEKVTRVLRFLFFFFSNFLCLSFFSYSYLFAAVIDLLLGACFQFKNSEKESSRRANFTMEILL